MADSAEQARVKQAEEAAKKARAVEVARREAHRAGVKRAQAESIIVHGPVR